MTKVNIMRDGEIIEVDASSVFTPPAPPSTNPDDYPLSPAQFKALVSYLDKDTAIRAAIAQTADALQRAWLLSRYENAESYNHGDPFLQSMRAAVGMSADDLAAAWMLAKDLKSGE